MPDLSVRVFGTPIAQPRTKAWARRIGGKAVARVYDPGTADGWKSAIAIAVREHLPPAPIESPVRIVLRFAFPRPKRLQRKRDTSAPIPHVGRPDLDNLQKAVFDALTAVGLWTDDGVIQTVDARKWYCAAGEAPGLEMRVEWDLVEARRSA